MISFQIKPWIAFGFPYLLIELFYIGMPVVRTDGRSLGVRSRDYHVILVKTIKKFPKSPLYGQPDGLSHLPSTKFAVRTVGAVWISINRVRLQHDRELVMFRFYFPYLWFCYVLSLKAFDIYARHFEYSCMRCFVVRSTENNLRRFVFIENYYSFKIFPWFWFAKSTRLVHHNRLLITKFGRILCLARKWRQKWSVLAG